MAKIARSTCTRCHRILPRTQMRQVEKSYHSGNSWGFNKKGHFTGARAYTRKRREWVCDDCYGSGGGLSWGGIFFFIVAMILGIALLGHL